VRYPAWRRAAFITTVPTIPEMLGAAHAPFAHPDRPRDTEKRAATSFRASHHRTRAGLAETLRGIPGST